MGLISLKPSEAVQGGLIDDAIVEVVESRFKMWDYNGSIPDPTPAIYWKMKKDDGDEVEQYWSVGSPKDFVPSEDGKNLVAVSSATAIKKGSNGYIMLERVVSAGFPEDKIVNDISVFEGTMGHVSQIPAPERKGLPKRESSRPDGREFPKTVLVMDRIDKFPWEAAKPKGAPATKQSAAATPGPKQSSPGSASTSTPAAVVADDEVRSEASMAVMGVIAEKGPTPRANLPGAVFKALIGKPLQQKVVKAIGTPGFLESLEGIAVVDGVVQFPA